MPSVSSEPAALPSSIVVERLVEAAFDGPVWLQLDDGRVVARGSGAPPRPAEATIELAVPGLFDMHCHGADGVDFGALATDPAPGLAHHARLGVTRLVATIATMPLPALLDRLRELAPLVHDGTLAGVHLEGPWLSVHRCGAHDPRLLRTPSPAEVDQALDAAGGTIRMVTLAPELPEALDAVRRLTEAGVTVALGHSQAPADVVHAAVDAGARVITHLYNGMPSLHHRDPGLVGVALSDATLTVEVIADGEHVADEAIDVVRAAAGGRMALISDAMAATGLGDGDYLLAGSQVRVQDGVARVVTSDGSAGALAGSTTTVGEAFGRLVRRGVPVVELVRAATSTPARALGLSVPQLAIGSPADLVEITETGVGRVLHRGRWLTTPAAPSLPH